MKNFLLYSILSFSSLCIASEHFDSGANTPTKQGHLTLGAATSNQPPRGQRRTDFDALTHVTQGDVVFFGEDAQSAYQQQLSAKGAAAYQPQWPSTLSKKTQDLILENIELFKRNDKTIETFGIPHNGTTPFLMTVMTRDYHWQTKQWTDLFAQKLESFEKTKHEKPTETFAIRPQHAIIVTLITKEFIDQEQKNKRIAAINATLLKATVIALSIHPIYKAIGWLTSKK